MSEPKRWLEDPDAPGGVQDLLRELEPARPPSAEKEATLVAQMLSSTARSAAPPRAASWLLAGACILGGVGALIALTTSPATTPRPVFVVASVPVPPLPEQAAVAAPPASTAPAKAAPPPRPAPSPAPPRDTLAEEEALLERARRALAASPDFAFGLLQEHRRRFPAGQLNAERMYLSVQVLRRRGDGPAAAREAQALMRRFPNSVYAVELSRDPFLSKELR